MELLLRQRNQVLFLSSLSSLAITRGDSASGLAHQKNPPRVASVRCVAVGR
jgi:hypothetical protein